MRKLDWSVLCVCLLVFAWSLWAHVNGGKGGEVAGALLRSTSFARLVELSTPLQSGEGPEVVIEVLDYECPPCRAAEPYAKELRGARPQLSWRVLHFPLRQHPRAFELAVLAQEAARRGLFPEFHEFVLSHDVPTVGSLTSFLSSGSPALGECATEAPEPALSAHRTHVFECKKLPIPGTPLFIARLGSGAIRIATDVESLLRILAPDK